MPTANFETNGMPHVAVCIDKARAYGRGLLQGIADYSELYGPWSMFVDPYCRGQLGSSWLRRWRGDGILAHVGHSDVAKRLVRCGIPCVDVYGRIKIETLPHVGSDEFAIGKLAAEHLVERELRNFAYCGYPKLWWSERRFEGFSKTLEDYGFDCERYHDTLDKNTPREWERAQQALAGWISELPKPIGVMACTDPNAHHVLDACRRAGVSVPEEVVVIGVDNDEDLCRLSNPPLSSVAANPRQIGYEGARLLHQLMSGGSRSNLDEVLIPPLGVVMRLSTDVTAIEDKVVAEAVSFIRKHACEGIQVDDVAKKIGRSRTTMYRLFERLLGRSPNDEILRVKLERAKMLLVHTGDSLEEIAFRTGFSSASYLSVAFKREIKMTPGEYRSSTGNRR
jgi:LacI family transcriptional regulator